MREDWDDYLEVRARPHNGMQQTARALVNLSNARVMDNILVALRCEAGYDITILRLAS